MRAWLSSRVALLSRETHDISRLDGAAILDEVEGKGQFGILC